jgi:hypothetical protein
MDIGENVRTFSRKINSRRKGYGLKERAKAEILDSKSRGGIRRR